MVPTAGEAAKEFADKLRAHFGERVLWVRLYGSYARGDADEHSDVDMMAVVRALTWHEKGEAIDLATDVSLARSLRVSAVVMSEADFQRLVDLESPFVRNVMQEGIAA